MPYIQPPGMTLKSLLVEFIAGSKDSIYVHIDGELNHF